MRFLKKPKHRKMFFSILMAILIPVVVFFSMNFKKLINKDKKIYSDFSISSSNYLKGNDFEFDLKYTKKFVYRIPEKYKIVSFPESLGLINNSSELKWFITVYDNKKYRRLLDGQKFDDIVISPDKKTFYIKNNGYVYYNDKKIDGRGNDFLFELGNNSNFAYFNKNRKSNMLNINGYIHTIPTNIILKRMFFNNNTNAFSAILDDRKNNESYLWIDDVLREKVPDNIKTIEFSGMKEHFSYVVKKDNKQELHNENGKIGEFIEVEDINYSPKSNYTVYSFKDFEGNTKTFLNENLLSTSDGLSKVKFSDDEKYIITVEKNIKENKLISTFNINSQELYKFDIIDQIYISKKNELFAFVGKKDDDDFLVVNSKGILSLPDIKNYLFSPDLGYICYSGAVNKTKKYISKEFKIPVIQPGKYGFFINNKRSSETYDHISKVVYIEKENSFAALAVKERNVYILKYKLKGKKELEREFNIKIAKDIKEISNSELNNIKNHPEIFSDYIPPTTIAQKRKEDLEERIILFYNSRDYLNTIDSIQKYFKEYEETIEYRIILADCLFNLKKYENVISQYKQLLKTDPENDLYIYRIGYSLYKDENYEFVYYMNKINEKSKYFDRATYFILEQKIKEKKYLEAENKIKIILKRDKTNFYANLELAQIMIERQKYYKAENPLKICLEQNKINLKANKLAMIMFYKQGRYDRALKHVKTLARHHEATLEIRMTRLEIYLSLGMKEEAEEDFEYLIEYKPDSDIYIRYSDFLFDIKKYDKGFTIIKEALKQFEQNVYLNNHLSLMYSTCPSKKHRDHKNALKYAKIAYKLKKSPLIKDTMATAYAQFGLFKDAIILMEEVVEEKNIKYFRDKLEKYKKAKR